MNQHEKAGTRTERDQLGRSIGASAQCPCGWGTLAWLGRGSVATARMAAEAHRLSA